MHSRFIFIKFNPLVIYLFREYGVKSFPSIVMFVKRIPELFEGKIVFYSWNYCIINLLLLTLTFPFSMGKLRVSAGNFHHGILPEFWFLTNFSGNNFSRWKIETLKFTQFGLGDINDASDVLGWALTQAGVQVQKPTKQFSILPAADAAQVRFCWPIKS